MRGPDARGEPGGVRASSLTLFVILARGGDGLLVAQKPLYPTSPAWVPAGLSTRADPAPDLSPWESRDGLWDQKAVRTGDAHAPCSQKALCRGGGLALPGT